jgi:hypothetical protein
MEIVDYLRAARRRLSLIILIPLLSAGAAAALLYAQPTMYMATATVDPPALVGGPTAQYTGAQGVIQFVAAFQATASGPMVRTAISEQTGVSTTALGDRLVVTQRGGSPSVAVTFTSSDKALVGPVVEAASSVTLKAMFDSQVASARARLDEAKAAVAKTNEAVGAFTSQQKMADPQKAYEAQLSRVNGLVQQQASMRATGNAVGAAAMSSPIASASAALDKFGPILTQYNALVEARTAAVAAVNTAQTQLAQASAQLDAADPTKIVYVAGARAVDRNETVIRTVIAVGAAAFILALLLVLMLEVIARGRTQQAELPKAVETDAAPAVKPGRRSSAVVPAASDGAATVATASDSATASVIARAQH